MFENLQLKLAVKEDDIDRQFNLDSHSNRAEFRGQVGSRQQCSEGPRSQIIFQMR